MKRRSRTEFVLKNSLCGLAFGAGLYVGDYICECFKIGAAAVFNFKQLILCSVVGWILTVISLLVFLLVVELYIRKR